MLSMPWPSSQPLRIYSKQCQDRDYMDVCSRFAIPGQNYCENHIAAKPKIVCLCGSTRFWETFRDVGLDLTMAGIIVLSIGICTPDSILFANPKSEGTKAQKELLDELHKSKIDLAYEILVLNVGGYYGKSTDSEIKHAWKHNKPIKYLFDPTIYPPPQW
jgi:hypothetical protein